MEMAAYAAAVMTSARGGSGKLSMAFKVRCEQCGKVSQFSQSDAGMTALCVACGARFTIPADPGGDALVPDAALIDAAPGESLANFIPAEAVSSTETTAMHAVAEPVPGPPAP